MNVGTPRTVEELLKWSEVVTTELKGLHPSTYASVKTSDATPTTILSIPIVPDYVFLFTWEAISRQTSGSGTVGDGLVYTGQVAFHLVSGTATLIGAATTNIAVKDDAGWAVAVAGSGNQAVWTVTGAASKDIAWSLDVNTRRLSH